jgi:uncharacterized membrane protein YheB (UPF0754 family)
LSQLSCRLEDAVLNTELLVKLSPLVIATLHGYGAAWLAVRMLFRPRRPLHLFGFQLPLTPGLLPKERERFIEALSTVISRHLLDVETVADEIAKLNLEVEITTIARREYLEQTQKESTIRVIAEHLRARLHQLRDSVEARHEIARGLRQIVEAEIGRRFSLFRRMVVDYFLDDQALYRIVSDSINQLADRIVDSLYVRTTIAQAIAQIPETVFQDGNDTSATAVNQLVTMLSQRLDLHRILVNRLSALSNEDIEGLVMETAGREIRAIVWFGAGIGLLVGIVQTAINFL